MGIMTILDRACLDVLGTEIVKEYNHSMGGVDKANLLRMVYGV